ncbi:aspartate/glutamate racemase family protein [Streptomyces radicis]|uniref:Asp/Glu racemase n=1 Tax=Streptomyces radicis TaxID=1750517 RepID=A0A3A9W2E0_9ACTN|nr:aspartate/glutamate racemase family protein [Streptomyces radicis]RKN07411.1 Asp/Glu racemase [Streptomyces radicis]RKN19570.1 Asp/Glu racemase [Streptomyces radicis]
MKRVRVINPNTSLAMTESIGRRARAVAAPSTEITAVSPAMGPESIESHYDEALAVPGVLAEVAAGESGGAHGHVIACFGDPGLDAAREVAVGPVVGIAEAAMHLATLVGRGFSVVTTLSRTAGRTWDLARRYGFERACLGVHACEIPVLDLDDPSPETVRTLTEACREAVARDRCDAVVLGCAGMAPLAPGLAGSVGARVVDGVTAAVKLVESLLALDLRTAKGGEYAAPPPKRYAGPLSSFGRRGATTP